MSATTEKVDRTRIEKLRQECESIEAELSRVEGSIDEMPRVEYARERGAVEERIGAARAEVDALSLEWGLEMAS